MAFKVNAEIIDIRSDVPRKTDRIFLDTNVIVLMGYTNASVSGASSTDKPYIDYLDSSLKIGAELFLCPLTYSETANVIETKEFNLVESHFPDPNGKKRFRQDSMYRPKVVNAVHDTWTLAKMLATIVAITIDEQASAKAEIAFNSYELAGYDLFIYHSMLESGITQILTHDADFGCAPNIKVHTTNTFLLREAHKARKILRR